MDLNGKIIPAHVQSNFTRLSFLPPLIGEPGVFWCLMMCVVPPYTEKGNFRGSRAWKSRVSSKIEERLYPGLQCCSCSVYPWTNVSIGCHWRTLACMHGPWMDCMDRNIQRIDGPWHAQTATCSIHVATVVMKWLLLLLAKLSVIDVFGILSLGFSSILCWTKWKKSKLKKWYHTETSTMSGKYVWAHTCMHLCASIIMMFVDVTDVWGGWGGAMPLQ